MSGTTTSLLATGVVGVVMFLATVSLSLLYVASDLLTIHSLDPSCDVCFSI